MSEQPEYKHEKFKCPHCGVVSQQHWFDLRKVGGVVNEVIKNIYLDYRAGIQSYEQEAVSSFINMVNSEFSKKSQKYVPVKFAVATCVTCDDISLWVEKEIVYPKNTSLPPPNDDVNEDIKELYREAAIIFVDSPKGAAAILRLALQKLLGQLGKSGTNINSDIKDLVAEGLSPKIQQALDLVRVVGNHAVHPGQIDLDDDSEIALKMFHILNFIADELITKPNELEFLYSSVIPEETQGHIKQRDSK